MRKFRRKIEFRQEILIEGDIVEDKGKTVVVSLSEYSKEQLQNYGFGKITQIEISK